MFSSAVSRNDMSLIDILQDLTDNVNKGTKNILCDTEIFSLTFSHFISSAYSFSGSSGDFSRSSLTYQSHSSARGTPRGGCPERGRAENLIIVESYTISFSE